MLILRSLLFPSKRGRTWALSSECENNQVDFADWIFFPPFNLMKEINPNLETLSTTPYAFNQR